MNFITTEQINKLKTERPDKVPTISSPVCDCFTDKRVVYHAEWQLGDKKGFSYCEGTNGKKTFLSVLDRCFLDANNKTVLTEYEYSESQYLIPFGAYKGLSISDKLVPKAYIERWASKMNGDSKEETELINACKTYLAE